MSVFLTPKSMTSALVAVLAATNLPLAYTYLEYTIATAASDQSSIDERLRVYADKRGVAELARLRISILAMPTALERRTNDVIAVLMEAPLRSGAWLDFAYYRNAAETPRDVAAALALSTLTAPNEGVLTGARALFALPLWADLPPNIRRSAVGDLLNGWADLNSDNKRILREALSTQPVSRKTEIRAALLLGGRTGEAVARSLELVDVPSAPASEEGESRQLEKGSPQLPSLLFGSGPQAPSRWPERK